MGKEDLRFRKTEQAIQRAFLTLLKTNTFEDITIKEICALAECNRNTFYLHYVDKHDLMEKLCDSAIEKMRQDILALPLRSFSSNNEWYMGLAKISLDVVEKNSGLCNLLLLLLQHTCSCSHRLVKCLCISFKKVHVIVDCIN